MTDSSDHDCDARRSLNSASDEQTDKTSMDLNPEEDDVSSGCQGPHHHSQHGECAADDPCPATAAARVVHAWGCRRFISCRW